MPSIFQIVYERGSVKQSLQSGVQIAGVTHVEHPRAWTSGTSVSYLHLVPPEQSHSWIWNLVKFDSGSPDVSVTIGARLALILLTCPRYTWGQDYVL